MLLMHLYVLGDEKVEIVEVMYLSEGILTIVCKPKLHKNSIYGLKNKFLSLSLSNFFLQLEVYRYKFDTTKSAFLKHTHNPTHYL